VKKKYFQTTDYIFQDFLICTDEAYFQVPPPVPPMPDFSNIEQLLGTEGSSAPAPGSWPHGAPAVNPKRSGAVYEVPLHGRNNITLILFFNPQS